MISWPAAYDKLVQLSRRLNIRISELFAEPPAPSNPPSPRAASAAPTSGTREYQELRLLLPYLCPELHRARMIPILTRIRAKSAQEFSALVNHSGEERIYVLEGGVKVFNGVLLRPGGSQRGRIRSYRQQRRSCLRHRRGLRRSDGARCLFEPG